MKKEHGGKLAVTTLHVVETNKSTHILLARESHKATSNFMGTRKWNSTIGQKEGNQKYPEKHQYLLQPLNQSR